MQQVNEDLKEIAKLCSINEKITTYVARHSSATILKRKGVSTTVISELLGHNNEEITQVYLDSFESPVLDTAVSLL
jgi:site-specific recombinase XerD